MLATPLSAWLKRRVALASLTVACVMAHAAVLGGLSKARDGDKSPGATEAAAQVAHVRLLPVAVVAEPQPAAASIDAATAQQQAPVSAPTAGRADARSNIKAKPPAAHPPTAWVWPADSAFASIDSPHLPTSELDVRPMPRSAPNEAYVESVHKSGLPIRVRLFIEPSGMVSMVDVLGVASGDEDAAAQVVAMFRDTAFVPGRRRGVDVPSFVDIEIVLEPKLPERAPLVQL